MRSVLGTVVSVSLSANSDSTGVYTVKHKEVLFFSDGQERRQMGSQLPYLMGQVQAFPLAYPDAGEGASIVCSTLRSVLARLYSARN